MGPSKKHPRKPRPTGSRKKSSSDKSVTFEPQPIVHGYIRSFDGTQLFYSREGSGKPLIFCYGLVCSSLHWTYQIDHFQRQYQANWFDYRGHQNSEIPKDVSSLTLPNLGRDLGTILDELKIKDAVFLGHSMGVNVVLEFYRQQPERVAGMILANGTAKRPLETLFRHNSIQTLFHVITRLHKKAPELIELFWKLQKGNPIARSIISLGGFNPHLTPQADIDLYLDQVMDMDPSILIQLIKSYDSVDATSWLHKIQAPTLILAGEKDVICPLEQQELMHQLIPNSRLEVIRHGSHCPQMDLPELVNLKIENFLKDINWVSAPTQTTETASQSTDSNPDLDPEAAS